MNFAHESLKLKSKAQNEDFCIDIETAQGHFFAVLDFAPHDYANLNATLKGKLETVVGSFASVSKFSADLFLGFLAKEINNFLHHLGEQSSGPEILCSAGLCLVGGNRLSYLLCGDVRIDITGGRLLSLGGAAPEAIDDSGDSEMPREPILKQQDLAQLGSDRLEVPLTDRVQTFTLLDDDVILIMTRGLEAGFDRRQLPRELVSPGTPDPKSICEALMKASASSRDDRTVVVIAGPYEQDTDPVLSDLSKAIALLEARMNTLAEKAGSREVAALVPERGFSDYAQIEQKMGQQFEALRTDLMGKAEKSDLLAFSEKFKTLNDVLSSKADSTELLGLKHDVLKLSKGAGANRSPVETNDTNATKESSRGSRKSLIAWALMLVLITALGAAFIGGWLQSRVSKKTPEVWTVRTTANQIVIRRLDGTGAEAERAVNLNVTQPLAATGEQTFSSFADVTQYIDRLTNAPASSPAQAGVTNPSDQNPSAVTEITVRPGDSLKKFAERYNVAPEKIKELNPTISRWTNIQSGQRIKVPSPPPTAASPTPDPGTAQPSPVSASGTLEVTVGPGDSLNRFAQRYNSTPERLRELNPQITNWGSIRTGQKLLVPAPPG